MSSIKQSVLLIELPPSETPLVAFVDPSTIKRDGIVNVLATSNMFIHLNKISHTTTDIDVYEILVSDSDIGNLLRVMTSVGQTPIIPLSLLEDKEKSEFWFNKDMEQYINEITIARSQHPVNKRPPYQQMYKNKHI